MEAGETGGVVEARGPGSGVVEEGEGTGREIALEDAAPAEFGQLLFLIEP